MRRAVSLLLAAALGAAPAQAQGGAGTREDRAALFDYLVRTTMARDAFAALRDHPRIPHPIALDVEREMHGYRDELLAADTDEQLYYALVKISNVRRDRHLSVGLVEGGLQLPEPDPASQAPIRFAVDYGTPGEYTFFVGDVATDIARHAGTAGPTVGDQLVAIDDQPIAAYVDAVRPYFRYSTENHFRWHLARAISERSRDLPSHMYGDSVTFGLERPDGTRYAVRVPYLVPDAIAWQGHGERAYPGFRRIFATQSFDLYRPDDERPVFLMAWHWFGPELRADMDRLMAYAAEHRMLDYALVWDGTRSRGGSGGAYVLQRLHPRPFRTTFGNLIVSDITTSFADRTIARIEERARASGDSITDADRWLADWLRTDVRDAIRAKQRFTNDVPFKNAHLPKHSDGIADPAAVHFRGPMVVLLGPQGGSHLDQFAAMVVDNELGHTIGMPAGGYSNTWEWEETLTFPSSGRPVASYMWSMGHTLRPNGELLQYNPAPVADAVPLTRENYITYHGLLLSRALRHLGVGEPTIP